MHSLSVIRHPSSVIRHRPSPHLSIHFYSSNPLPVLSSSHAPTVTSPPGTTYTRCPPRPPRPAMPHTQSIYPNESPSFPPHARNLFPHRPTCRIDPYALYICRAAPFLSHPGSRRCVDWGGEGVGVLVMGGRLAGKVCVVDYIWGGRGGRDQERGMREICRGVGAMTCWCGVR